MNVVRNDSLIKRYGRIGQFALFGGLLVLAGGMYVSFTQPTQLGWSAAALILGFGLSQVGIYFANRWGRSPRPDEQLTKALKGLDGRYTIYHFTTPVSHLLVGPSGVWVLLPYHQKGTITYAKGRWRQTGGSLASKPLQWYLRFFAQEGLGRPDIDVGTETEHARKYFAKILTEDEVPEIQTALVFLNPKAEIAIPEDEQPPAATTTLRDLKDVIRKTGKKALSVERAKTIQDAIEMA